MGILIPGYDNHAVRSQFSISTFSALVTGDPVKKMMTVNWSHTLCIDKGAVYAHRPDFNPSLTLYASKGFQGMTWMDLSVSSP